MISVTNGALSVWEIAHRAYGADPDNIDGEILLGAKDLMRLITKQLFRHELTLCTVKGTEKWNESVIPDIDDFLFDMDGLPLEMEVLGRSLSCLTDYIPFDSQYDEKNNIHIMDPYSVGANEVDKCCITEYGKIVRQNEYEEYLDYCDMRCEFHNEKVKNLELCFRERVFDKSELDDIFIFQPTFAKFCDEFDIEYPEFWFGKPGDEDYDFYKNESEERGKKHAKCVPNISFTIDDEKYLTPLNTKKLKLYFEAAIDAYETMWGDCVESDKSTWPTSDQVIKYLENKYGNSLNVNDRKSIQVAIRHDFTVLTKARYSPKG